MSSPRLVFLSGFLGSGKTTLIRRILQSGHLGDVAVVINEAADIGIDQKLVPLGDEQVQLIEGGCVCCSSRDQTGEAVEMLLMRRASGELPPFDTLIVESTGLADPLAAIALARSGSRPQDALDKAAIVVTLDAVHGLGQLDDYAEARRQVAAADLIFLTKSNLARSGTVAELVSRVRDANAHAPIVDTTCSDAALCDAISGLVERSRRYLAIDTHSIGHTADVRTLSLNCSAALPLADLTCWLHDLCRAAGARLMRVKGLLRVEQQDRPMIVHCVSGLAYPLVKSEREFDGPETSSLVVIMRGLDAGEIANSFRRIATSPGTGALGDPT